MNTASYIRKYVKKDGTISEYKQIYKLKGTKSTGRPKALKTKLMEQIEKLSHKTKENLLKKLIKHNAKFAPF